ncbi:hypothetical protein ACFLRF_05625 [Candidatus Altiarchaeota archaeon]
MVQVKIREFLYIKDIPVELTAKAIMAGELTRGKTVGLDVETPAGHDALIELLIKDDGQTELLHPGQVIPVESSGSLFVMDDSWMKYRERISEKIPAHKIMRSLGGSGSRKKVDPTPS